MAMPQAARLRLGTRGSLLALWQANWVKAGLEAAHAGVDVELVPVRTTGDRVLDRPLSSIGGKGLFTKELDEALLRGQIGLAVHSLKDLPFRLTDGITLAAVLARGDPRDALVSDGRSLSGMPPGSRIGTGSLRRRSQLLCAFPGLEIGGLRGNVDTRLRRFDEGAYDGIVLSAAGLERLGHGPRISEYLDPAVLLPAVGQGAVAAVCREDDAGTAALLGSLDDAPTRAAVMAERALLEILEGSCQVPIGGYAVVEGEALRLRGRIASPDGRQVVTDQLVGTRADPVALGRQLGERLLEAGGRRILADIRDHGA